MEVSGFVNQLEYVELCCSTVAAAATNYVHRLCCWLDVLKRSFSVCLHQVLSLDQFIGILSPIIAIAVQSNSAIVA